MHFSGKNVKMSFERKTCRKLANGQDIDYSENKMASASTAPLQGLFSMIFKHIY